MPLDGLDQLRPPEAPYLAETSESEPERESPFRRARDCDPPTDLWLPVGDIEEARAMLRETALIYMDEPAPVEMLGLLAPPGTGKSTIAVEMAEIAALRSRRTLYAAMRHDFFGDLMGISSNPHWWYEWLPRQAGSEDKPETCRYAEQINVWLTRGYPGIEFCKRFCGWDYVNNNECPYHAQRRREEPIIFGQHQHVSLGHPLAQSFRLLIGDESPLLAFCHRWLIPGRHIAPPGMDPTEPITEMLHSMQMLAERKVRIDGKGLLAELGGPTQVRDATESVSVPLEALVAAPNLRSVYDVDKLPYFHLPALARLLHREAVAAEAGHDYPTRVALNDGHLILLLRRKVNEDMPGHVIWCDATANRHLYETVFGRPVRLVAPQVKMKGRIFQIYDRQNGKGTLLKEIEENGQKQLKATAKAAQLKQQVAAIVRRYAPRRVAIISFQGLEAQLREHGEVGHFYGARGTNRFEECAALIVAGVPQPGLYEIEATAKMLYWDRMEPFLKKGALPWSTRWVPFRYRDAETGRGKEYLTSAFWHDADLNTVLWQMREAELIQAAHRIRPNLEPKDIWLLENLPIDELPPNQLMETRDLFGAPEGVDCYRWPDVLALAELYEQEGRSLISADLMEHLGIGRHVALKYLQKIKETQPDRWDWALVSLPHQSGRKKTNALLPVGATRALLHGSTQTRLLHESTQL